ncbi:MAG: futalosine hydrolase [Sphingobacteriales bacterium]|jgi:futalosine hydrolase|nr:futalosine hydrolase [Sphingobacteriales bacterium]
MQPKITIVSATLLEVKPLFETYKPVKTGFNGLFAVNDNLHFLITGMGMMNTAAHLALYTSKFERDFYIDAGVCGAFNRNFKIGDVVQIISETYGDFGVENDEEFQDFFDLGFIDKKEDAFQYGMCSPIEDEFHLNIHLPEATSITVNKVHGNERTIKIIQEKYNADTENMEGLAFYYVLKLIGKPGIEIRAISNYVERRNKENWDVQNAVKNLNMELQKIIHLYS